MPHLSSSHGNAGATGWGGPSRPIAMRQLRVLCVCWSVPPWPTCLRGHSPVVTSASLGTGDQLWTLGQSVPENLGDVETRGGHWPFQPVPGQSGKQLLHRQTRVTQQLGSPSLRTAGRAGRAGGGDLSGLSTLGRRSAHQGPAEQSRAVSPPARGPLSRPPSLCSPGASAAPWAGGWGRGVGVRPACWRRGPAFAEVVPTPKRVPFQLLGNRCTLCEN